MASPKQLHVVAVPLPAQGHLNPLMRFCQRLASLGALVTFVDIDPVHHRIDELTTQQEAEEEVEKVAAAAASADNKQSRHGDHIQKESIRRAHIPIQGFDLAKNLGLSVENLLNPMPSIAAPLEALVLELNQQGSPVTCLIYDITMTFPTQHVADKLGIPGVVLFPSSASTLLSILYVTQGDGISIAEALASLSRRESKREVVLEGLPGLPTIYNTELHHFKHDVTDDNAFMWDFLRRACEESFCRARAIAVNSFEELEGLALATVSNRLKLPIHAVGPLVEPLEKESSTSLWKENDSCLQWLDQQPHLSVLYISFGSIALLAQTQLEEILSGLVSSNHRFLWVVRPDLAQNMSYSNLTTEILSRSQGKGYLVDWAPQLRVLSHPSVGGFLTHCGWNSTLEAISSGVPMLCWPCNGDQFFNAKYIVEEWKVGFQFEAKKDGNSLVESCEVERVIKALMEGEEGKALRKNAMCLKEGSFASLLRIRDTPSQDTQALLKSFV